MSTSSARTAETRRSGRSAGQWLLGLFIVLALAASVLMVFTDTLTITGSLAVIAALWAAVIGAILVTKFRRQAETAEAKSRDLRLVYELQLEREIAARRQYELDVESTIRREVTAEANQELIGLKEQLASLRASLEHLLGEALPETRVALPNERLRELASGLENQSDFDRSRFDGAAFGETPIPDDSMLAAQDFEATAPAPNLGRHESSDVDPNEMTEVIPIITDDDPVSGRIATVYEQTPPEAAPAQPTPGQYSQPFQTPPQQAPVQQAPVQQAPEQTAPPVHDAPAQQPLDDEAEDEGTGRRRRRRGDDDSAHSTGLPVSELLSQLREAGAPTPRRRRIED